MDEAVSISRAQLEIMQGQYRAASAEIRNQVGLIVTAEKQAAESIASGHLNLAAIQQKTADVARSSLDSVINKQQALGVSVAEAKAAMDSEAAAANQAAAAVSNLGTAHSQTIPEIAAASAAIRVFEGAMPIRAVERFAVSTLGLGPILQAAFPVIGAIALSEMLVTMVEHGYKLYDRFINLREVINEVREVSEKMGDAFVTAYERVVHFQAEALRRSGQLVAAARLELSNLGSVPIKLPEIKVGDIFGGLRADFEKSSKAAKDATVAFSQVVPGDLASRIRFVKDAIHSLDDEYETAASIQTDVPMALDPKRLALQKTTYEGLLTLLEQYQERYSAEITDGHAKIVKAGEEEQRKLEEQARKAEASRRKHVEELRRVDEDALAGLRSDHEVSIQETISFWQRKLAEEAKVPDRVREIHRALGALYQQAFKEESRQNIERFNAGAQNAEDQGGLRTKLEYLEANLSRFKAIEAEYDRIQKEISVTRKAADREDAAELKKAVDEQYEIWLTGGKRSTAEIINFWTGAAAMYSNYAPLVAEATKRVADETKRLREEQTKLSELKIQGKGETRVAGLEQSKAQIQRTEQLSYDQSTQAQVAYLGRVREIDRQIIQEKVQTARAIADAETDPVKHQQALNKLAQLQAQANAKWYADTTAMLTKQQAQYRNFFNQISSGFGNMISGMLTGQRNWAQGLIGIETGMINSFSNMVAQRVTAWIAGTAVMQAAETAWHTILRALHIESAVEAKVVDVTTKESEIMSAAALAAANAYAATAIIPFVGPELAPAAAASAFAAVAAFSVPAAFETGGIVPNTGIAMVHQGEAVLPSKLTSLLMGAAGNTTNSLQIGDIHVHGGGSGAGQGVMEEIRKFARRNNMQMA